MKGKSSASYLNGCQVNKDLERNYQYFVSKISHEIRNPLTLVYSSLQLVEKKHPDLSETQPWEQLKQEVKDTIILLNDLSAFTNKDIINPTVIRPSDFLKSLELSCRPAMEAQGIDFIAYSMNKLPLISVDAVKLKEALLNLLKNAEDAVKQLPAASPSKLSTNYLTRNCSMEPRRNTRMFSSHNSSKQIALYAEFTGYFINFHVRDNGIGIRPEYMDTLFDPFVTHKQNGTGLGLSIVKSIIDNHSGAVSIQTNHCPPATYTDVCLSIPVDANF